MSIYIKDNRKPNALLQEGALLRSVDGEDYGILFSTDIINEEYNVLLLSKDVNYPETVYAKGTSLSVIQEGFVSVANAGEYDITVTIGKE